MSPDSSAIVDIKNLTVTFKSNEGVAVAVDSLDMQLFRNETLGIVGESGSGKSVTSLALMGLILNPPGCIEKGEIIYNGQNLLTMPEKELRKIRGNEISMIFQEPMTSLNPILTCGFQISESLVLHRKITKIDATKEAVRLLESVGMPDAAKSAKRFPHQLSGGMRQRVMIAMALACNPKILIADEPTTALDVTIQAQILDLIKELTRKHGTSVIMITHDLGVVSQLADRVMVMYAGQNFEVADTKAIFEFPMHPYTKGLISTVPQITKERQHLVEIPGMVLDPTKERVGCTFHDRCARAMDICKRETPQLTNQGNRHFVRCWLYGNSDE
jgi:oligopeptide/dipeptide ABC transporter ATP-binding protein